MRHIIVYFSGTGNTRFIANIIKKKLAKNGLSYVETISVEDALKDMEGLLSYEMVLGIGYPVYDFMPPKTIKKFLSAIDEKNNIKGSFIFNTYSSFPLDSNYHVVDVLQSKSIPTIAMADFKAPGASAYMYMKDNFMSKSNKTFEPEIDMAIECFCRKVVDDKPGFMDIEYNKHNAFYQKASEWVFSKMFYRDLSVNENCTNCGKCVRNCADENITLTDDGVIFSETNKCMKCLRCVQSCPNAAINFTAKKRYGNYTGDDIAIAYNRANGL